VALGDSPEDLELRELVPPDVPLVIGHATDVLARYVAALEEHPAESVVRVCANTPFVDPVLIDRLVNCADEHPACDYISFAARDGRPAILTSIGLFAEWCTTSALRQAHASARDPADRTMVTRYIYSHPEKFSLRFLSAPAGLDRDDVRLRVDFEEDWDNAQTIFEALGPESLDWQRIAGLLEQQPELRNRMAALNQRRTTA
jgi:spore coat polysaccharide biosynthesis protein SpsF